MSLFPSNRLPVFRYNFYAVQYLIRFPRPSTVGLVPARKLSKLLVEAC